MDNEERLRLAKEALESGSYDKETIEYIFPELAESEDEKIRKVLLNDFKNNCSEYYCEGVNRDMIIAWLEKQGEKKETLCDKCKKEQPSHSCQDITALGRCVLEKQGEQKPIVMPKFRVGDIIKPKDGGHEPWQIMQVDILDKKYPLKDGYVIPFSHEDDYELVEQKSTDKVEPKFKVGDWIVFNGLTLYIKEVVKGYYRTISKGGITNSYDWDIDNVARLWTIQDVKDGAVLHSPSHHLIWIYKDNKRYYACVNMNYVTENVTTDGLISIPNDACPATEDGQTILFARMKEAGYEWDAEKKELKKIEQKPAEFGENRGKELSLSLQIQAYLNTASDELYAKGKPLYSEKRLEDIHKCMLMWQKLHNAYFYQNPSEWSEEDDYNLQCCIAKVLYDIDNGRIGRNRELLTWLNSLKERVHSKQEWSDNY